MDPTDHIQLVTFQLEGLSPDAYRAHCEAAAPAFTQIPGLRAKAWLANPSTNTYGGVYAWDSREAMEAYVAGPIFGALLANPAMAGVTTRDFGPRAPDADYPPPVNRLPHGRQRPLVGSHIAM